MKTLVEHGIWKLSGSKLGYFVQVSRRLKCGVRASRQGNAPNLIQARILKQQLQNEVLALAETGKVPTFEQFLKDYYTYLQDRISPSSLYRQSKDVEAHLLPFFRNRLISQITRLDLELVINERTKNKAAQTKKHLISYTSGIFKRARELELILSNPCDLIERPKIRSKERLVLSEAQIKLLLAFLRENFPIIFKHAFLSVHTLARAGELRAPTWADVDFERNLIKICKTLDPRTGLKETTKNGLARLVPINAELENFLKELQQETFLVKTDSVLPPWREFSQNEQGKPLTHSRQDTHKFNLISKYPNYAPEISIE